nr:hypothetical protein [Tanacetum cinerariifolium]
GGDEVSESEGESDEEETRQEEEESFDPIPRTPEGSEDESNDEEDQELRLSEEARIQEEEEADELYRDVNINQGRGLPVIQNIEDSHVTLTPVHPDGPQKSSSVSSFVTSMLNPISDAWVESIFTTASSLIVSLQAPTPIMTPSTIATITTSGDAPIPPTTIPSIILENLPTFNSAFRFDERLRSLETTFFEYRQTNPFVDVVSAIPGIVHQYITQQMTEAVREAVQIQTDRLQDSLQRENDEFLRNINENMKKIIKGKVKSQVKEQVSRILPRIEESVNATLKAEVLTRSSHSSRTSYAIAADLTKMELKKILIEKMEGNKSIQHALWGVSHWGRKRQQFYGFAFNRESALDVYSKRRIIAVTKLKIVEWHNYKHLDWISVRRDDDKIYKFKEGDFKRLRLQDIERLSKTLSSRFDGTLNDVRNALDNHLKGIRMQYFPTTIWRRGDKDRAAAMIQAIDKMLKTRRILRSLENEIVTHWFTLIVLSALRRSDNENMLSLVILIHRQHKREVEIPNSSRTTIHNHMLIPYYQDFSYSDGFECFQAIIIGREHKREVEIPDSRTMDMTIYQQVALDEALVPHASRVRIKKSNFRLRLDITSKESTLQLVYGILRLIPFYKAFLVTTDVPEIHEGILGNCRSSSSLNTLQDGQLEKFLGHSKEIKKLTDVNINKFHQPWRSFAAVINKCLSEKIRGYDSLRFTKVIIYYFMTMDPSNPRRNKVNWHNVRDDQMFTTIKLVLRHQNTQQFGVMLPIELTNEAIRNSKPYKEYYAVVSGAAPPKTKASVRKTKSSSENTITSPTTTGTRLLTSAKGKQPAEASKAKSLTVLSDADEGTGIILGVPDVPTEESDEKFLGNQVMKMMMMMFIKEVMTKIMMMIKMMTIKIKGMMINKMKESFDLIIQTPENSDDEGNDDVSIGLNVGSEEGQDTEDDENKLYRDVNINLARKDVQMTKFHTTQEFEDTHVTVTLVNPNGQQHSSSVSSQFFTSMLNPSPDAGIYSLFKPSSQMDVPASTTVASLTLTAPTLTSLTIPTISRVPQAPTPPTTALSTLLQDLSNFGLLFRFDHRLKTLEANFSEFVQTSQFARVVSFISRIVQRYMDQRMNEAVKIIKEQVKEQVKTSYAVAADLSEMELKKILIEKMESNKSIHRSDEQTNLYKALKATKTTGKSTQGSKSQQKTASESALAKEPMQTIQDLEEPSHQEFETGAADDQPIAYASQHPEWFQNLAKQADSRSSFNELMDTHVDFLAFLMNRLKVDTLAPELLAGLTYELIKGSCKSRRIIPFDYFINNDFEYLRGGASSHKYTTSVTKTKAADYRHIKWIEDLVPRIMWSQEQIVEWHNYKHLDWITVRRDDEKLYKFKEGVKSYQKKLNLTKPDTYHSDLKRKEAYTAYSNPRGFIYQNKDKQNRLMRIDELHKFSDGILNDVQTALDDRLKGIRMKYLPKAI